MAENHQRPGLVLSPAHSRLKLGQKRLADRVALVRPIQPEPSDASTQLVGNSAFGVHSCVPSCLPFWLLPRELGASLKHRSRHRRSFEIVGAAH